jgi:hypothetical protein
MLVIRAALIALLPFVSPGAAGAMCFEPSEPYCVRSFNTFEDRYAFDSCLREMEAYRNGVTTFKSCREDEIAEIQDEIQRALRTLEEAVKLWNCRAKGGTLCP